MESSCKGFVMVATQVCLLQDHVRVCSARVFCFVFFLRLGRLINSVEPHFLQCYLDAISINFFFFCGTGV